MKPMTKQETLQPKKRGPKPTGIGTPIQVRLQPETLAAVDEWRKNQAELPSRPGAIRKLIELGLKK